tara:strand:+ start:93 stop:803 length:711 start_codon:yes stop_codon:yes gene_type:complete
MSKVRADQYTNKEGTGAPSFPNGVSVTGVLTATSFSGSLAGTASNATVAVNAQGLTGTPNISVGTVSGTTGTFSGNVSVGGTLTYDDVTNIDSVGLVTARTGVKVTAGGVNVTSGGINVTAGVSTFSGGTKITGSQTSNISAMGANSVDCSAGNYFTKTITGATTFTFDNVPSGVAYTFTMEVTLNGSNAITWPAAVKWPADTPPTITDGKTQLFVFITDDGGTRWRGSSVVDYTN